jgi:vitamin B12 transporter
MKYALFLLIIAFTVNNKINGQAELKYNLESVVVTANRVPVSFSEVGRSIEVISAKEMELLPVNNIQDLLELTSGLDIKQRGPEGVQADVSIRGGSFEQTLILVDGIKLTDPQTGHHNMNLPISFSQIERVEILKGQGSRIYGANAFSGVINIITKKNAINNLNIDLSRGENQYYDFGVNGSLKLGNTNHHLSLNKTKSDGYRHNTEFNNNSISINNSFNLTNTVVKTLFGYTDKDFGANSYYTTRFPDQAEHTKTYLAAISAEIGISKFNFSPKLYWRKNEDEFVLRKHNPAFYKNNHETNVYGGEIQASTNILGGSTSFGLEYTQDQITSNNLGEHKRETKGIFAEQKIRLLDNLNISLGGFAYHYSQLDWRFWPGFDVAYNLSKDVKIFANYGRAFRVPSYTELYYSDPVTLGNADLAPEESINYEFGLNYEIGIIRFNTSYFRKEGTNLIDYVLDTSDELWKAKNFTKINTDGVEIGLQFNLNKVTSEIIKQIKIDYTYLNSDKADLDVNSRYVLEHLEHDLTIKLYHDLPLGISQSWAFNYEDRLTLEDHLTMDTKLTRIFSDFSVFVKASNLLNNSYEEIPGVPLPGRWIIGGVKLNIL